VTHRLATTPDTITQAHWVRDRLAEAGTEVHVSLVDAGSGDPLDAFERGDAALALVPGTRLRFRRREGLPILAVPAREEPRDMLVTARGRAASLRTLAAGAKVGVTGARRRAFLRAHRPDLVVVPLTNGTTPAIAIETGLADAAILGVAEARRAGLGALGAEVFDPKEWLPAPGQGSLALIGAHDLEGLPGLDAVNHEPSRIALETELTLVDTLSVPAGSALGALAQPTGRWIRLWAAAASEDGAAMARCDVTGSLDSPRELAETVAHQLIERGIATVLASTAS
jgi:hydroxymethylbilane synthase